MQFPFGWTKFQKGVPLLLLPIGLGILMLPGARRLPHYRRTAVEGITTLTDAVIACHQTGLEGWALVTHAQQLVSRKFTVYSVLNLWDPPGRAFAYGMGYCTQYNLALKTLLDDLGFTTQAVFCNRVQVLDNPDWTMGHTWLRVTIKGETRDVCAGRETNEPGKIQFVPRGPVHNAGRPLLFLTHLGVILYGGMLEWKASLTGNSPPDWAYRELNG